MEKSKNSGKKSKNTHRKSFRSNFGYEIKRTHQELEQRKTLSLGESKKEQVVAEVRDTTPTITTRTNLNKSKARHYI